MTLIVTLPATDGLVIASDSQVTAGPIRRSGEKLHALNNNCIWGAAGELALIQRVGEQLPLPDADRTLLEVRDELAQIVKSSVESLLKVDFRTQFFANSPGTLLALHEADFVFAEMRDKPRVLHILNNGTAEWIDHGVFATGSGAQFAYALLERYEDLELNVTQCSVLAFKTVDEAIEVGAYGLGRPVHMWVLTVNGALRLDDKRMARLEDIAQQIRDRERRILMPIGRKPEEGREAV